MKHIFELLRAVYNECSFAVFALYSDRLFHVLVFFQLEIKGEMILQFEPQPLPAPSDRSRDNDLDISLEQEPACDTQPESACDTQQDLGQTIEEEVPKVSESKAFKLYIQLEDFSFIVEEM